MSTKTKIALYVFLGMITVNCQEKKDAYSTNKIINKMNDNIIETTLLKQLKQGSTYNIDEAGAGLVKIPFEMHELEAAVQCVENILNSNGFKKLNDEDFSKKVKNIFGRVLDYNSNSVFLYINSFDRCNRELVMYKNNEVDYNGTFLDKQKKIITDFYCIPELIDYQKDYHKLNNVENVKIVRKSSIDDLEIEIPHWKDISNLKEIRQENIQKIVNRNKYLFNDNKASLVWLKFRDEAFLESLVKIFGYVKDKDLLKWVLDRSLYDDEFDKILITKSCDNKYVFNKEVFEVIAQADAKNKEKYFNFLREHFPKIDDLDFSEDTKIKALYCYYSTNLDKNNNESSFYSFFPKLNEKKYEDEFRKNNYYNIPDFKKLFEDTKNGGIGLPM